MNLNWIKCKGEVWCKLETVNLNHSHFDSMDGVYIIWHGGSTPQTVYVGKGKIRERLTEHRQNPELKAYANLGLYVTWASVPANSRSGVEKYLADVLAPIVGKQHPNVEPIFVNSPWEETVE